MKSSSAPSQSDKVVVFTQNTPHETEFDGKVEGVELNGIRLKDVHDLAIEVEKQTQTIRKLAWLCGVIATFCLAIFILMVDTQI